MDSILLLGAGKIGGAIVELLGSCGDYRLTVGDRDDRLLDGLDRQDVQRVILGITDGEALRGLMAGKDAVISALCRIT